MTQFRAGLHTMTQSAPLGRSVVHFEVEAFARPSDIEHEWRWLEAGGVTTVFQRYDWHVLPHEKARPAIVLGRLRGRQAFVLPLAISRVGLARVATRIGGKQSGYSFGLLELGIDLAMASLKRIDVEKMLASALDHPDFSVLARTPRVHDSIAPACQAIEKPLIDGRVFIRTHWGGSHCSNKNRPRWPQARRSN